MLILYSSLGCHLCEQALALLEQQAVRVQLRDILDDPLWLERYAVRIPVLSDGERELDWPFNSQQLKVWLN